MSWLYSQIDGKLYGPDGNLAGQGYSGGGTDPDNLQAVSARNNPERQSDIGVGPIPAGWYTVQAPVNSHVVGGYAMALVPDVTNQMFRRDGFYCHGDSLYTPGFASDGCLVQCYLVRVRIWESNDHRLQVVAAYKPPITA